MAKFHVNTITGNAGKCKAKKDKCPFGKDEEHYGSAEEAREAFESGEVTLFEPSPLKTLSFNGTDWKNVSFKGGSYADNRELAIQLYTGGEPLATASINLDGYGIRAREGAFFIKNWSENSGIAEALEKAGVVTLTGNKEFVGPFSSEAVEAELTPKYSYLATETNWHKMTDETPEPVDIVPNPSLIPAAATAVDITDAVASKGLDYSVSFQNHRGREASSEVLSDGEIYKVNSDGSFTQVRDPKAGDSRRGKTPSPEMSETLKNITSSLMSKKTGFLVGFGGSAWSEAADTATVNTKDHYFTIGTDGTFKQTDR